MLSRLQSLGEGFVLTMKNAILPQTAYAEAKHNNAKHACNVCADKGRDIIRAPLTKIDGTELTEGDIAALQQKIDSNSGHVTPVGPSDDELGCLAYMHSECPLNRRELGRASWAYLHTLAAYYPEKPTKEQQEDMTAFIRGFARWYPCGYCADKTRDEMIRHPPRVESQKEFAFWMCQVHNEVNDRMGKPIFDCNKVDERWKTGPADGSCK